MPGPVGVHPEGSTPEGIHDLAGNVAEWVADGYAEDGYGDLRKQDPEGPAEARLRVTRGGSYDRKGKEMRGARRESRNPGRGEPEVGFRCAWPVESASEGD